MCTLLRTLTMYAFFFFFLDTKFFHSDQCSLPLEASFPLNLKGRWVAENGGRILLRREQQHPRGSSAIHS
jgi:hypothetical protein